MFLSPTYPVGDLSCLSLVVIVQSELRAVRQNHETLLE